MIGESLSWSEAIIRLTLIGFILNWLWRFVRENHMRRCQRRHYRNRIVVGRCAPHHTTRRNGTESVP